MTETDTAIAGQGHWPRAVLFDLDGTLVDSLADIATALNALFARHGLAPQPPAAVRAMVGGGVPKLVERAWRAQGQDLTPDGIAALAGEFLALYAPRACEQTTLYPGATALLERLAEAGVRLAVCTNKPGGITTAILRGLGVLDRFSTVVGGDSALPRKPDPAMVVEALRHLGTPADAAVMVGDSGADVGAAHAAGVVAVAVSYGYGQTPASGLGADAVIDRLSQLPSALAGLCAGRAAATV